MQKQKTIKLNNYFGIIKKRRVWIHNLLIKHMNLYDMIYVKYMDIFTEDLIGHFGVHYPMTALFVNNGKYSTDITIAIPDPVVQYLLGLLQRFQGLHY